MRTFALQDGCIRPEDMEIFQKIDYIFDHIPSRHLDIYDRISRETSCHVVSHALAQIFNGYHAVDGRFHRKGQEHSRLEETTERKYRDAQKNRLGTTLIDPYPIGGIRPQIYYACRGGSWRDIYTPLEDENREQISSGLLLSDVFEKRVEITKKDMLEALNVMKEQQIEFHYS